MFAIAPVVLRNRLETGLEVFETGEVPVYGKLSTMGCRRLNVGV